MKKIFLLMYAGIFSTIGAYSQSYQWDVKYSAVNPGLLLYTPEDVLIVSPQKFDNGKHVISPNPTKYPWEGRLENGMPNVIVSEYGDLSIYLSSFVAFASKPPSKVGAIVYTNNTDNIRNWTRPEAGLYWFDTSATKADDMIKPEPSAGLLPTNIVAVDIESVGMFDDYNLSKKGIKLIYLPQRESNNSIISGYEMDKSFNQHGILNGFETMKYDRQQKQVNFTFDFINGDTHMGYLTHDNKYSFVSRLNAKRSFLKEGETLPLRPDNRKRYRRETVTPIGSSFISEHVSLNIALDMSTPQWEPYSMQPMQLPDFKNDIWWGLVTMFGTEGDSQVQHKQRTELAISNDGFHWRYLKPGTPFLDNGTDPSSDDYGCINIAIPVNKTKLSQDPKDLFYFYAASNLRHISGRNPGISVAIGKSGKWAALTATNTQKNFLSPTMPYRKDDMPSYSIYQALYLGNECFPRILADVTEDPRGKTLNQLGSFAALLIYAYDTTQPDGIGSPLAGTLGSSKFGTTQTSEDYEAVGFIKNGMDGNSKVMIFNYLKELSRADPHKIISVKEMSPVPVVIQSLLKNTHFYGISFKTGGQDIKAPLDLSKISNYIPYNTWTYRPTSQNIYTKDFKGTKLQPNEVIPTNRTTGTVAIIATPTSSQQNQTLFKMYGDSNNNNSISIDYTSNGNFLYTLTKDGFPFAQMSIEPPTGKSFANQEVTLALEVVPVEERKYGKDIKENVAVFTLQCPGLGFQKSVPQPILWNWKHSEGSITNSDKANAQAFAFLEFSSFTPDLSKLTIGAADTSGTQKFNGIIKAVQVADHLPDGNIDFWE